MYSPRPFSTADAIAFVRLLRSMFGDQIIVRVGRDGRNGVVLWRFRGESQHGEFKRARSISDFEKQEAERCSA